MTSKNMTIELQNYNEMILAKKNYNEMMRKERKLMDQPSYFIFLLFEYNQI